MAGSIYKNKLALIVGGSEGIGKCIADELVQQDCHVIVTSRNRQKLESTKQEIAQNRNKNIEIYDFDVTDYETTRSKIDEIVREHGTPDYLFNCAGFARPGYLVDLDMDHFRKMMDLNYFGIVHSVKSVVPYTIQKGSGHIVNTSSIAGFIGLFGYTGYCASKYAVVGFSEALKRELAPYKIRVSVLCPPNTRTPGLEKENEFKPSEVLATEEKAKVVDPEFVARDLLKRLHKNPFFVIPTFDGALAHRLSRHLPGVLDMFVRRPSPGS